MGFFSSLFSNTPTIQKVKDGREAFAAIMFAAMAADGDIGDEERDAFIGICSRQPYLRFNDIVELYKKSIKYYEIAGSGAALVDSCIESIYPNLKAPLFINCVDIILSDGVVSPKEEEILEYLKNRLNISDDLASKTVEVFLVKNSIDVK